MSANARRAKRAQGAAALLCLALAACGEAREATSSDPPLRADVSVEIRGERFVCQLNRTPEEFERGLAYRDGLAANAGMLFPFASPGRHGFWMNGMRFDIDIVWILGDRVVDVTARVPHAPVGGLPTYHPREDADLVLEIAAGRAREVGIAPGDPVRLDPPLPPAPLGP
jgi:hypothetical protein